MLGKTNAIMFPPAHIELTATEGDNTLHLRTQTAGYDCVIHWGDGAETTAPVNGGNIIHNYAQAGVYHIFISGRSFAGFYVNNQTGKEKYTALHSMGRWVNDTLTSMANSFFGCSGLMTLPCGLFQYSTAVTTFATCFNGCTGLATLPYDLFAYSPLATTYSSCFNGCTGLLTIQSGLFKYGNIPSTITFISCFANCNNLTLREDIFGRDYANRFSGKTIIFTNCFNRTSFTGIQGTAPQLWNFTYRAVTTLSCFRGDGNSETSISNYADIPAAWK